MEPDYSSDMILAGRYIEFENNVLWAEHNVVLLSVHFSRNFLCLRKGQRKSKNEILKYRIQ